MQPKVQASQGSSSREEVSKNLWISRKGEKLRALIKSNESTLVLQQDIQFQTNAIEKINDCLCYIQQKKYYIDKNGLESSEEGTPMQQVCVLKVSLGCYNYNSQEFNAKHSLITIYQLPGHEISDKMPLKQGVKILEGECDSIQFILSGQEPRLSAHNLNASITQPEVMP